MRLLTLLLGIGLLQLPAFAQGNPIQTITYPAENQALNRLVTVQNVAATQEWPNTLGALPAGEFVVHYLVFTSKPKATAPLAVKDPNYWPPYFQDMADGTDFTLTPSPEGFLNTLRKTDPTLDFKIVFAGQAISKSGVAVVDSGKERPTDPFHITVKDEISLSPKKGKVSGTFDAKHNGATSYVDIVDGNVGHFSDGWSGVAENVIARTYHMGGGRLADGSLLTYAYCIMH